MSVVWACPDSALVDGVCLAGSGSEEGLPVYDDVHGVGAAAALREAGPEAVTGTGPGGNNPFRHRGGRTCGKGLFVALLLMPCALVRYGWDCVHGRG